MRKVFVVCGVNHLLGSQGPVGIGATKEIAERIEREQKYLMDESQIIECIFEED